MRKPLVLIQGFVAVVSFISGPIDPARSVVTDHAVRPAKITSMKGRVFKSDLNEPISNVTITILEVVKHLRFDARSDTDGKYHFPNIEGGVYKIWIQIPDSERIRCHPYLQNLNAVVDAVTPEGFDTAITGFEIKAGKEVVQDFAFACKRNQLAVKRLSEAIRPAFEMLELKGLPLDAKLLLDEEWRAKLEPAFAQIPDLQKEVRATSPMSGLYLARTLFLPERIDLSGDTVILVRDLAPVDGNSSIWISGKHRLVILVTGDPRRPELPTPRWTSKFLRVEVSRTCGIIGLPPVFDLNIQCPVSWTERHKR